MKPFEPRITKSTSVATVLSYFPTEEELLLRYDLAKEQANLWDGERDGLRNAVKLITDGTWGRCVVSRKTTAATCYVNAEGKHQIENCLQTSIPEVHGLEPGTHVVALTDIPGNAEGMAMRILHELQNGKDALVKYLENCIIGDGRIIDNATLYSKEAGERMTITVLP